MSVDKQQIIEMIRAKSPRLSLVDFKGGKSEAWGRFRRVQVDNVTLPYAVCNGCFKPVHYTPRDGTGGLRRHTCEFTVAMSQPQAGRTTRPADKHHGTDQSASSNTNAAKKSSAKLQGEPLPTQHESHAFKLQQQLYAAHRAGLLNMASHQVLTNLMAAKVHPFHELLSRLTSPPVAPAPATTGSPSSASLSPPVASGSSSSKSPQGISDIALDLAAKRSRQESGNVAMDFGDPNALSAQQDRPTKRRRKRSHPDRTVRPGPCISTEQTEECPVGEDPVPQFEDEPLNLSVSSTRDKQPSVVITTSQDESTSALDYSMKPHDLEQSEIVVKVEASSTNTDEATESEPPVNDKKSCSDPGSSEPLLEMKLTDLRSYLVKFLDTHRQISEELEDKMPVPDLQKPAPQFSGIAVVDGQFKNISLEDYKGKYVVLFFYPLDFTFVCPTEIIAFSERAEEFRQIGCELIACSTDSHFCHLAWVNTPRKQGGLGSMNIPLLADKSGAISKAYGVYKDDEGLTFRGLFIIDGHQNLRQVTINDLPVGRSVDETLRLVQAFQFTDKHGEVCPAGWTPGKKSMKADPTGSKEYFESQH